MVYRQLPDRKSFCLMGAAGKKMEPDTHGLEEKSYFCFNFK